MISPVISIIVKNELCIGCGVCAAVCPEQKLEMRFNHFGEYSPIQDKECIRNCGICLKVCPFADGNSNEDILGKNLYGNVPGILHLPETGYYLDCYVGFAKETRDRGASGGMATWFLSTLLEVGVVSYIIAVVPNDNPDQLFKYQILSTSESVFGSAGSAYYPVELSSVLKEIQNRPGKCAIIGIPCFIKAIRLATQRNNNLKEKILLTAGLVCGQLKSKNYTEYIAALSGVSPPLQTVYYREKSLQHPASNFYFSSISKIGESRKILWNDGVAEAWNNRWFTPNACNYCDDVFAESADITFMDAWLPEYIIDVKGTSLVLVRSQLIQKIIQNGIILGQIYLNHISVQEILRSQDNVIQSKKVYISFRLYQAKIGRLKAPNKRIPPNSFLFHPLLQKELEIKEKMRIISRNNWRDQKIKGNVETENFKKSLDLYLFHLKKYERISKFFSISLHILQLIPKKIWSYLNE